MSKEVVINKSEFAIFHLLNSRVINLFLFDKVRIRGRITARVNRFLWNKSPELIKKSRLGMSWGRLILKLVRLNGDGQLTTTYFYRNRPELELLREIFTRLEHLESLKITIIGCSEGAEVFSILHTYQKARNCADLNVSAFDIDESALEVAKTGRFNTDARVLSTLTPEEIDELFDKDGVELQVKDKFRNIDWHLQDPTREPLTSNHPKQDIVIANRFLFHMDCKEQYRALKAIVSMVRPGGYLFVSGVDLGVRTRVANEFNLLPIQELIEEIHAGDETMTMDWPIQRWGLEPLSKKERDWKTRYCSVFQVAA
jgi:2-polyprenyl-3-methyl-5-hydroxy-6-metoxy-1,4-benzoquinol methylase